MFGFNKRDKEDSKYQGHLKRDSFEFERIERYFVKSDKAGFQQTISDRTFNDLDMEELFMFIDRTISKPGQQYLYHYLRTMPANQHRSDKMESRITLLEADSGIRNTLIEELSGLNRNEAYSIPLLFHGKYIERPSWFWAIRLIPVISVAMILLAGIFHALVVLLIPLLITNFTIHYWNKKNVYHYGSAIPQLLILNGIARNLSRNISPDDATLHESIKAIDGIGWKMVFFKFEGKSQQSELEALAQYPLEILKLLFLIEPVLWFTILKELESKKNHIHTLYRFVAEWDVSNSISFLRKDLKSHCRPSFVAANLLRADDLYHPLIVKHVANTIALDDKSAFLSGSNMSGKTTFIRTIGINVIMGQAFNVCFAQSFTLPRLRIHSAIHISDDLMNDKSYYFEEVVTIKNIIEESRSHTPALILLDELFKGTNTIERIASGKAILNYLARNGNIVFISSHDLELSAYLTDRFDFFYFSEEVIHEAIEFDYKLKHGILQTTNAIRILELKNYPAEIIKEALELTEALRLKQ